MGGSHVASSACTRRLYGDRFTISAVARAHTTNGDTSAAYPSPEPHRMTPSRSSPSALVSVLRRDSQRNSTPTPPLDVTAIATQYAHASATPPPANGWRGW